MSLENKVTYMNVFEVETKFRVFENQVEDVIERLMDAGGKRTESVFQEDTYYDHPCRTFAETDEALRIRYQRPENDAGTNSPPHIELTYKGPKVDDKSKTRAEISVPVDSRECAESLLLALGFTKVYTVRKERHDYLLKDAHVSVDRVDSLGHFIELETETEYKSQIEEKRDHLLELAEILGLDPERSIRLSYLELLLSRES